MFDLKLWLTLPNENWLSNPFRDNGLVHLFKSITHKGDRCCWSVHDRSFHKTYKRGSLGNVLKKWKSQLNKN